MLSDLYSVDSGPQPVGYTFPWLKTLQASLGEGIGLSTCPLATILFSLSVFTFKFKGCLC